MRQAGNRRLRIQPTVHLVCPASRKPESLAGQPARKPAGGAGEERTGRPGLGRAPDRLSQLDPLRPQGGRTRFRHADPGTALRQANHADRQTDPADRPPGALSSDGTSRGNSSQKQQNVRRRGDFGRRRPRLPGLAFRQLRPKDRNGSRVARKKRPPRIVRETDFFRVLDELIRER